MVVWCLFFYFTVVLFVILYLVLDLALSGVKGINSAMTRKTVVTIPGKGQSNVVDFSPT